MLFYITGGAPQAVPGTACVEANRTACTEDPCSSATSLVYIVKLMSKLFIEYSVRFKIVFGLALNFYVYIDDDKSTKEAKQILF